MALKSTVFKAEVQLADIDHGHYTDLALTLARHPSETDERMMVRLVTLLLHAHQVQALCGGNGQIGFGAGLSTPDAADVLLEDFSGRTRLWIELGQPDEKRVARACSRADQVIVYAHGPAAEVWWRGAEGKLARFDRTEVWRLPSASVQALAALVQRSMKLQATLQDGLLMLTDERGSVSVEPIRWH